MLLPLDDLAPETRVWIYQADRPLNEEECAVADAALEAFVEGWTAHGAPVYGHAGVWHQRFLVVFADEAKSGVSGCSIDASVAVIRELGERFGIDFFQRLNLACQVWGGLQAIHKDELETALEKGTIGPETLVFDNTVQTKTEWEKQWERPLKDSWAGRMVFA
jgi:hypothetical protein